MSIDCRFSAVNRDINREQLNPPYYPHVTRWEEIMKGWKNPTPLLDIPSTLNPLPKETPLEITLNKPSRFI